MGIQDENRHLEEADKKYIWHPFTQMKDWFGERPVIISEGRDCFIKDIYGRWYLDGVSSMWVNIHGHRKKEIDEAIKEQIDRISHSTLFGLSSVPAIRLAERLIKTVQKLGVGSRESGVINSELKTPNSNPPIPPLAKGGEGGFKVFYSDNGSTSVEVALKMAFQYWIHKGIGGRNTFLSLRNAYHGDTLGAVSVGGVETFHKVFSPLLFKAYDAPSPYCYRCEAGLSYPGCKFVCLERMEDILRENSSGIAAVIIEPLVQAAGGMIVSPPGYLKGVRALCTKYNVLLIADEVATGFGRTGKMFACEHEDVVPDIMCLSKGITGGYLPLAATIATDEIYNAFLGEFRELKTFFHGHSYTGNPLACAAALACLDIFEKENTLLNLQPKIKILETWLKEISDLPHVGDVRNKGLMAGVELVEDRNTKKPYPWEEKIGWKVAYHARENSVFIRPLGNVIVVMPPLSISAENLLQLLKVIKDAIIAVT
ncbi:MAG: adenosylmethionine--8-amino-7-oxononanoate transaminase [Thermodesulfovibrionales bacterium]|nr:adenosylmethionine--8-amino-7-oxononanoate transaminase [Thermodesulfovibrionales bacterium]